jgi:coenzyme F420-reducing hydrogenase delta subunit
MRHYVKVVEHVLPHVDQEQLIYKGSAINRYLLCWIQFKGAIQMEDKETSWEPKIIAFLCNWCSYAGADLAGVSRIQYPPNTRTIRVPCSGRVNPLFILKALQSGADGVLVSGCHPGDCHYLSGNYVARRKFAILKSLLKYIGVEEERVQFSWVSAAEGSKFAEVINEVTKNIKSLGKANKLVKKEIN